MHAACYSIVVKATLLLTDRVTSAAGLVSFKGSRCVLPAADVFPHVLHREVDDQRRRSSHVYAYFISTWNEHCKEIDRNKAVWFSILARSASSDNYSIHCGQIRISDEMWSTKKGSDPIHRDVLNIIKVFAQKLRRLFFVRKRERYYTLRLAHLFGCYKLALAVRDSARLHHDFLL